MSEFEATINRMEQGLRKNDYEGTVSLIGGLVSLRQLHEDALDKIMRGLYLKRRDSDIMKLLEKVFSIILQFAALTRDGEENHDSEMMRRLFIDLKSNIRTFVARIREGSEDSVPDAFVFYT